MVAESATVTDESGNPTDFIKFTQSLMFKEKFADFRPFFGILGSFTFSCHYEKYSSTTDLDFLVRAPVVDKQQIENFASWAEDIDLRFYRKRLKWEFYFIS